MNTYLRKGCLGIFILLYTLSLCAQQGTMISGRVLTTEKEILDFATVYLKDTNFGCTTNEEGLYHLKAPAGEYTLVVSAIGYKTIEKTVTLIQGQKIKQNITIVPITVISLQM